MPAHLKTILSAIIFVVCLSVFYYDHTHGGGIEKWVAFLLGPLMVLSIWIFPEAESRKIRNEAASRRSPSPDKTSKQTPG